VGQALFATDALEKPAEWISNLGGSSTTRTIIVLLSSAFILSAFLNNTPVVVMLIPIIVSIARRRNFAASRALLPLSFVGILGGMTTLIGSSTNLLVAGVAERYGYTIGFFDFTPIALVLAGIGFAYVLFIMPRLLPKASGEEEGRATTGRQFLAQIELEHDHPLIGEETMTGLFPSLSGITVRSVQRGGETVLPPFEDIALQEGDILVVAATRAALTKAFSAGKASLPQLARRDRDPERGTDQLTRVAESFIIAEAVVAPGSRYTGRTIEASRIRTNYGTPVLGLQRRTGISRGLVRQIRLEAGDTLLIGGLPEEIDRLRFSRELLLLERSASEVPLSQYANRSITIFAAVVLVAASGLLPIVVASLVGAYAMIASGCLSIRQAARSFDRQIFMMVGASLAAAVALEHTGGAAFLANSVVSLMEGAPVVAILSVLFIFVAMLTNILSNNATAVLFTPIAISIAQRLEVSLEPFVVCIILAANCSFATPVGYQTNLLVLGPGRYRFSDYLRTGIPLILILWITFTLVAPVWYEL
jgi:di/tricarboxylate transporter